MANFYCDECGSHIQGGKKYTVITRRGSECRCCSNCICECKYCEENYAPVDSYVHEDCAFEWHKTNECSNSECSYCSSEDESEPDVKEPEE